MCVCVYVYENTFYKDMPINKAINMNCHQYRYGTRYSKLCSI